MKITQVNGVTIIDLEGDISFIGNKPAIEIEGTVYNVEIHNGVFIGQMDSKIKRILTFIKLIWKGRI